VDIPPQQQQHKDDEKKGFTIGSTDESFSFYDFIVRRVWLDEDKKLIMSNKFVPIFMHFWRIKHVRRKTIIQTVRCIKRNTFLDDVKKIQVKFQKCYLFMGETSQHKSKRRC